MKKQFLNSGLGAGIGMLLLILDSKTALSGARDGIRLITQTVIPSLFPFFFLSVWLTGSADCTGSGMLHMAGRIFRLPYGAEYLLLPAFLGGYPSGAQAVTAAWEQGRLSEESAKRLLGFCSNAGPSFLFGILGSVFPEIWMVWILWGLHIGGAAAAAWLLPPAQKEAQIDTSGKIKSPPEMLHASISIMAAVCGWVLLFRIVIAFLDRWILWMLPDTGKVLFSGLVELTNGCCTLTMVRDIKMRFLICAAMLSAGGICVLLQTRSVTKTLDLRYYYRGKLIQMLFSVSMGAVILYQCWFLLWIPALVMLYPVVKKKKSSSIPMASGV